MLLFGKRKPVENTMTTFYNSTEEALEDPLCPDIFCVGTSKDYKLYILEGNDANEHAIFVKHVKSRPDVKTYRTFEEAIEKVEDGGYVGIGHPNAQLIYRVNKKNYAGNPDDKDTLVGCFNFLYHFNK